jgi:hypothetical protein
LSRGKTGSHFPDHARAPRAELGDLAKRLDIPLRLLRGGSRVIGRFLNRRDRFRRGLMIDGEILPFGYFTANATIRDWQLPHAKSPSDVDRRHRTEYDFREGAYWVPIEGQWIQVPTHAIIRDRGNPVGEAVMWYVHRGGIISCFVPADAV